MALPFEHTYARNATIAKIKHGGFDRLADIRITGLKGNMNIDQPWITLTAAVGGSAKENGTMPSYGDILLDKFSSTCIYFGMSLATARAGAKLAPTPLGLIHTAWGGSMIEQWLTDEGALCISFCLPGFFCLLTSFVFLFFATT